MNKDYLWWRDGITYQIYPRSYADSNNDGIGDLPGIISKLDYIQDLGVDAIWLSPIFPSPDVDFGYDVADYTAIDPKFGTMADFDRLLAEAHHRDIHIILDLVLNHTSDQHPWFIQSQKSIDNPYHDWYLWANPKPHGDPPNNWVSWFGGPAWEYDPNLDQYYYHMFFKEQPDLNWRNPDVRAAMLNVFRFWLKKGVDGFRLDVFNAYFKDPEFKDNPSQFGLRAFDRQKHIYDVSQPEMFPLLREIRAILDKRKDTYVVGETFLADPQQTAQYCGDGKLHAAFNLDFAQNRWHPKRFLDSATSWYQALPEDAWPNNFLSNHDCPRAATRYCFGEDDRRAKIAIAMLLTLKGTPFVYYGEEIGMLGNKPDELLRTLMQWSGGTNTGFTTGTPWQPANESYTEINVALQEDDPSSLLNHYRFLVNLRNQHPALRTGAYLPFTSSCRLIYPVLRVDDEEAFMLIANLDRRVQEGCILTIEESPLAGEYHLETIFGIGEFEPIVFDENGAVAQYRIQKDLDPYESLILMLGN